MADLNKHRQEAMDFSWDFADHIGSGDALNTIKKFKVVKDNGDGTFTEVSSEFGTTSSIDGTSVDFHLSDAGSDEQSKRGYIIYIEVETDDGEILVDTPTLSVDDKGDTTV